MRKRKWKVIGALLIAVLAGGAGAQTMPGPAAAGAGEERQTPIEPAAISVSVTGSLEEVAAALTQAMGVRVKMWPGGRGNETFTLEAKGEAFWDVYAAVSRQHPIVPRDSGGFSMAAQGWGMQTYARTGGFALWVEGLARGRSVNLQAAPGAADEAEKLTMDVTVGVDPRVVVLEHGPVEFTEVVDDLGHNLAGVQGKDQLVNCDPGRAEIWGQTLTLDSSQRGGTKIASAKATARFIVQTAERRVVLGNAGTRLGQPISAGARVVTFSTLTVSEGGVQIAGTLSPEGKEDPPKPTGSVRLLVTDAGGQQVWHGALTGAKFSMAASGSFKEPLKAELIVSSKWEEVTIPFELKDVTLPK